MFKYNNTHIFTGYLKQFLASSNIPTCKIYTKEFADYLEKYGKEDPRVLQSFNAKTDGDIKYNAIRINYLKDNEVYCYFKDDPATDQQGCIWHKTSEVFFDTERAVKQLTRSLNSYGSNYDTTTHEYLGEYLRFLRDYYNINLMPLYNCFNNKIYNNIYFNFVINNQVKVTFNSQEDSYRIYAIPVKLFAEYTIAADCSQEIEMFCGFYNTHLDTTELAQTLASKTYLKVKNSLFNQPFLYSKLSTANWLAVNDFKEDHLKTDEYTRWSITNRESDLRLFIKIPTSCTSSITILEGDYTTYNNHNYIPIRLDSSGNSVDISDKNKLKNTDKTLWKYSQNCSVLNFKPTDSTGNTVDLNDYIFKPISKLQLLAFNTGESYPFSDRLVEYLIGSAITSIDPINDNIKRTQQVMELNKNYFKIEGLWEPKMQNLLYDHIIHSGPIKTEKGKLVDKRQGTHPRLGHSSKSTLYDVLGYVDKDAEKLYAHWILVDDKATMEANIHNVDIYDELYDIK
jgi:hypothetical protein